jgi:hypothetical protein
MSAFLISKKLLAFKTYCAAAGAASAGAASAGAASAGAASAGAASAGAASAGAASIGASAAGASAAGAASSAGLLQAVKANANNAANRTERVIFYPLRYELKLNQLRRTTLAQPSALNFTSNKKKFHSFLCQKRETNGKSRYFATIYS